MTDEARLVSEATDRALARSTRVIGAVGMTAYQELPLEVQPHWGWAWIVIKPER